MKALNSRARLAAGIVDTVTIRFATICLSRSKTDGAGPSVYIARTNAGRMLRSFVEQPRSWSRWAKKTGGRFSSHNWKQKRLITKNVVGEIKQLDESDEGTDIFFPCDGIPFHPALTLVDIPSPILKFNRPFSYSQFLPNHWRIVAPIHRENFCCDRCESTGQRERFH